MDIHQLLKELVRRQIQPGPIYVWKVGEIVANRFRVRVLLPPIVDPDTINAELSCLVNGVAEPPKTFDRIATDTEYVFDQGASVKLSLVNIDDAGNRSTPSEREFVVTDNVPPAQPGELAIEVLGEE